MAPPGTFERVYAALKAKLRSGALKPGERLEPAALSEELFASVTPVRDALHRLTGERLVEAPRQEGFRVPMLTETRLRHLYAWHRDLLILAILRRPAIDPPGAVTDETEADSAQRRRLLFDAIATATGNPEHRLALASVAERLEPLEQLEALLLDKVEEETRAIAEAIEAGDLRQLRTRLLGYHRRRERIVPELLARLEAE